MDDTNTAELTAETAIAALESEGYTATIWREVRIYVKQGRRDLGYVDACNLGDIDQATKTVTGRRGDIRATLRGV